MFSEKFYSDFSENISVLSYVINTSTRPYSHPVYNDKSIKDIRLFNIKNYTINLIIFQLLFLPL